MVTSSPTCCPMVTMLASRAAAVCVPWITFESRLLCRRYCRFQSAERRRSALYDVAGALAIQLHQQCRGLRRRLQQRHRFAPIDSAVAGKQVRVLRGIIVVYVRGADTV